MEINLINSMVTLLVLLTINIFSFSQSTCSNKHYINVKKDSNIDFPKTFVESEGNLLSVDSDSILNVNLINPNLGKVIDDSVLLYQINKVMDILAVSSLQLSRKKQTSVFYLGDASFKAGIVTRILFMHIKDGNDYFQKVILGFNIMNDEVVSIIKFSETEVITGFSNSSYSRYVKNQFNILHASPSDITGEINRKGKVHKIKMRKNGKLRK